MRSCRIGCGALTQLPHRVSSLQFDGAMPTGSPVAARIMRGLQEPPYSRLLPREDSVSPQSVALAGLAAVLDPHNCTINIEPLKQALREAGVLEAVAQLAANQDRALVDPAPTMATVQALWRMNRCVVYVGVAVTRSTRAWARHRAPAVDASPRPGLYFVSPAGRCWC